MSRHPTVSEVRPVPPNSHSPTLADRASRCRRRSPPVNPVSTHSFTHSRQSTTPQKGVLPMRDFHTPTAGQGRYVGPDAWQIAGRLPHRVRFERGWFHTAAVCHGSLEDRLSFRQRPDGGAIDVRCHAAQCSRQRIVKRLEGLSGESIWSAYQVGDAVPATTEPPTTDQHQHRRSWIVIRLLVVGAIIAMLVAPLAFGYGLEVVALHTFGLGWATLLVRQVRRVSEQRRNPRRRSRGNTS